MVRVIKNRDEKYDILYEIINFNSSWAGHSGRKWAETFFSWINTICFLSVVKRDTPLTHLMAVEWECENGTWYHGNGKCDSHNYIGMAYAQWFKSLYDSFDDRECLYLSLADSPDFFALVNLDNEVHHFYGDIGQCTICAFFDGFMRGLGKGDLWITVLDEDTDIVIETKESPIRIAQYLRFCEDLNLKPSKKDNFVKFNTFFEMSRWWIPDKRGHKSKRAIYLPNFLGNYKLDSNMFYVGQTSKVNDKIEQLNEAIFSLQCSKIKTMEQMNLFT